MSAKVQNIYQFKITLKGIKPKIWRQIQIPGNYSFYDFHIAIQEVMGWFDYHLHQFEMIHLRYGEMESIDESKENKAIISKYFSLFNKKASYEYDFGDSWEHTILLEKILPAEKGSKYPKCLAGERACPPEDCGGVWGYEGLLEAIKNPNDSEYQDKLEWIDDDFKPDFFNPKSVMFLRSKIIQG